jgi:hypothetical protein
VKFDGADSPAAFFGLRIANAKVAPARLHAEQPRRAHALERRRNGLDVGGRSGASPIESRQSLEEPEIERFAAFSLDF